MWSYNPRIIREGGYQPTTDPGEPPAALFLRQITPVVAKGARLAGPVNDLAPAT